MSASTVTKEIQLGTLVAVPLSPRLTRELSMVYAPEKFRSKLLDAFISFVENKFQQCNVDVVPMKRPAKGRSR
jgi:DNA-binding transcriptional LysR family regulator